MQEQKEDEDVCEMCNTKVKESDLKCPKCNHCLRCI